jgi:hypothetical protein
MSHSLISQELVAAYLTTDYRVRSDSGPFVLRIGQRSAELADLFERTGLKSAAFITAENPFSVSVSAEDNHASHLLLCEDLAHLSLQFFEGEGQGEDETWPAEKSVLILGIERDHADSLGTKYGQNAIVWIGAEAVPELVLLR